MMGKARADEAQLPVSNITLWNCKAYEKQEALASHYKSDAPWISAVLPEKQCRFSVSNSMPSRPAQSNRVQNKVWVNGNATSECRQEHPNLIEAIAIELGKY